jgi:AraC-like DNA-binding protein
MGEPTVSMRVVQPFVKALTRRGLDPRALQVLEQRDPDARIEAAVAVDLLRISVRISGDEALGLAAALETAPGDYGELEYAVASCSTARDGLDYLRRHYFLLDEASAFDISCEGQRVRVSLRQPPDLVTRAGVDFALSMFYLSYVRWVGEKPLEYEVEFPYAQPLDLTYHRSVFGPETRLHFDTGSSAVVFRSSDLDRSLRYSDPKLHALLATQIGERSPGSFEASLTGRVRARIWEELHDGCPSIEGVARRLAMSSRSLARKLEEEGTSFKQLLCDVRRACAVRYLLLDDCTVEQVSQRLGYQGRGAFHRAFRSWFGQTPASYREQQKRDG